MELVKLTDKVYYIKNNTNIGVIKLNDEGVVLIDTGNDDSAGKKILKILDENNMHVKYIINTHSHADHIGGNKVIQNRTNAKIYASSIEKDFVNNTILEPSLLYGAYPFKSLQNKFLKADNSVCNLISVIDGLEIINLSGHSPNMIGVLVDECLFLGDALLSEYTIEKYHIGYIYNVKEYLNTLDKLESIHANKYIASHVCVLDNIDDLIKLNRKGVEDICDLILDFCISNRTLEDIVKYILDYYDISINITEYTLITSTIKAYLTYLYDLGKIEYNFNLNKMYWSKS